MPLITTLAGASTRGYGGLRSFAVAGDFESIATVTLSSTASTVTFSSIPQTYTHLQLRVLNAQASATHGARLWFNGDTTNTNYWVHALHGNGTSVGAGNGNGNSALYYSGTTSGYLGSVIDILDYTNTNKKKVLRSLEGYDLNGSGIVTLVSQHWNNTAAVTSLQFSDNGSNFQIGGSYALYGIKGA